MRRRKSIVGAAVVAMCMLLGFSGVVLADPVDHVWPDLEGTFDGRASLSLVAHNSTRMSERVRYVTLNVTAQDDSLVASSTVSPPFEPGAELSLWLGNQRISDPGEDPADKTFYMFGLVGPVGVDSAIFSRPRLYLTLWSRDDLTGGNLHGASMSGRLVVNRTTGVPRRFHGHLSLMFHGAPEADPSVMHYLGHGRVRLTFTPSE